MEKKRDLFGTRWGFILACIGSAVGMGNIWMFPTRVSKYGGGTFLLWYFFFVVLIGSTGVIGEMSFGRATRSGPVDAFGMACETRGKRTLGERIGLVPVFGSMALAIGYTVVMGWIFKYMVGTFTGATLAPDSVDGFSGSFGAMASAFGNNGWQIVALVLTFAILIFGVGGGIERANKVMMPVFFFLFLGLGIYIFFQPGAATGYQYIFRIDASMFLKPEVIIYAMGQAFFSLSITGSGMIIYGSYLSKKEDIPRAAMQTALLDTCAALLAGFAILPAVFAFGMDPASGPPLIFITLPKVFAQMPGGRFIAVLFFLSVIFAGITSLINMFEVCAEAVTTHLKLPRKAAVVLVGALAFAAGAFIEFEPYLGKWMDAITIYVVPFGALLCAFIIYWVLGGKRIGEELVLGRKKALCRAFLPTARYLYVGLAVLVFILSIICGGIG